jgi:hypothetical protein
VDLDVLRNESCIASSLEGRAVGRLRGKGGLGLARRRHERRTTNVAGPGRATRCKLATCRRREARFNAAVHAFARARSSRETTVPVITWSPTARSGPARAVGDHGRGTVDRLLQPRKQRTVCRVRDLEDEEVFAAAAIAEALLQDRSRLSRAGSGHAEVVRRAVHSVAWRRSRPQSARRARCQARASGAGALDASTGRLRCFPEAAAQSLWPAAGEAYPVPHPQHWPSASRWARSFRTARRLRR